MEYKIIKRLCDFGYEAKFVGGYVRDSLLGLNPEDIDIVTNATPENLSLLFSDLKVDLVGANFLVTMIEGIEVATYRTDWNLFDGKNGCRPIVAESLKEDLARRDLTINAIAICPFTGDIFDPFNGVRDLKERIIKFVGNANDRIKEDPTRMLRACRFVAHIEGNLSKSAFMAISDNAHLVKDIAPERIRAELLKAMKCKNPSTFFVTLHLTGLLHYILPELADCYGHKGGKHHNETVWDHCMMVGDALSRKDPLLRLVGYLHDIGKPPAWDGERFLLHEVYGRDMIVILMKRLKFYSAEIAFSAPLVRHHMRMLSNEMSKKAMRKNLRVFEKDGVDWRNFLALFVADTKGNLKHDNLKISQIAKYIKMFNDAENPMNGKPAFVVSALEINGKDVMDHLSLRSGSIIGCILDILLDAVIDNPELNNCEDLFKLLDEI